MAVLEPNTRLLHGSGLRGLGLWGQKKRKGISGYRDKSFVYLRC